VCVGRSAVEQREIVEPRLQRARREDAQLRRDQLDRKR
jgi:hypothetical protein